MIINKPSTPKAADDKYKRRRFAEMDAAYARQVKRLQRIAQATRAQFKKGHDSSDEEL